MASHLTYQERQFLSRLKKERKSKAEIARRLGRHRSTIYREPVRSHAAELGVAADKIVAAGGSAGGHPAASTYFVDDLNAPGDDQSISPHPNAMILYNPVVDLVGLQNTRDSNLVSDLSEPLLKQISPAYHIRKDMPPTLVIDGTADRFYPRIREFVEKGRELGAPVEASYAEGQPHGFFNRSRWLESTTAEADQFLRRIGYLSDEPEVPLPARKASPPDRRNRKRAANQPRPE